MHRRNVWLRLAALAVVALTVRCTGTNIDDGGTPDVVMEVANTDSKPITTTGTISANNCVFVVTEWTSTLNNRPKSSGASVSPFNDIALGTLTVSYVWDDASIVTAPQTFNISGTVPANGSVTVKYPPILLGNLDLFAMPGHSANTTLLFEGRTVGKDERITATGLGAVLTVGTCAP